MLTDNKKEIPLTLMISESLTGNVKMQKILYQQFSVTMYYVCLRYLKNKHDADDVLQDGFIKVFKNLEKYKGGGSFEGWIKKIMTNTALSYLRDNKKFSCHISLDHPVELKQTDIHDKLTEKEIIRLITKLPPGYKKIFMLHVIEGYNHREIAQILGCSESTSKSQFHRSKIRIRELLKQRA